MIPLEQLEHVDLPLPQGGHVLVLNTGAAIGSEAEAMLQALHSRSIGGVNSHLEVLTKRGPQKFMATYYVGYGHKSIGDCGSCTIFIEGVSMLAAKAIQDWPLYSGQESSTRYIDFAQQPFIDPAGTTESHALLEAWRTFYLEGLAELKDTLRERFPRQEDEDEKVYGKAIDARAFDIMRGFLPAGASTNLAWHSNLRQVADKLLTLRQHPLAEVREIAETTEAAVATAFPSSFDREKRYAETEQYNQTWMHGGYYYENPDCPDFALARDSVDRGQLAEYRQFLENRPPKTELPKQIAECGTVQFEFLLDFGSFRDIQRQRAVIQRMPRVTTAHGFAPWYLEELPESLQQKAAELLANQAERIASLDVSADEQQYYTAMGYQLPNRLTGGLSALVYLVELRATRFVHPTLRQRARQMADALSDAFADAGLVLHLDDDPDRFDVRRGEHDITPKS